MNGDATTELSWVLARFAKRTAGVDAALAVSSDGLVIATSEALTPEAAAPVAALVSGIASLGLGAAAALDLDELERVIVAMRHGMLLAARVSDGSLIAVFARNSCDIGTVSYEMTLLADRAGKLFTPALIMEIRQRALAG